MNLPKIIQDLVETQNNGDATAYAACFSETAVVLDEGKTYNGREEIKNWIAKANEEYNATTTPIDFSEIDSGKVMKAKVSGTFPGSPLVLKYHLELENGFISSLKITG